MYPFKISPRSIPYVKNGWKLKNAVFVWALVHQKVKMAQTVSSYLSHPHPFFSSFWLKVRFSGKTPIKLSKKDPKIEEYLQKRKWSPKRSAATTFSENSRVESPNKILHKDLNKKGPFYIEMNQNYHSIWKFNRNMKIKEVLL